MRDRPDGLDDDQVRRALRAWAIEAASLTYEPVGFGDYHWSAADAAGQRWFVTAADLERKNMLGGDPDASRRRLRRAMDTAFALAHDQNQDHHDQDRGFVVAPVATARGETVQPIGRRYLLSVFPHVDGDAGRFDQARTAAERGQVIDLLTELHRRTPPRVTPVAPLELLLRADLDDALARLDRPWLGGPFAEPARTLTVENAARLRRRLEEFDRGVGELRRRRPKLVVTHGEPHPGNLLRSGGRYLLIDWDTVGLAVPERDLWSVATSPGDLARYADASGHRPDPAALHVYRLRWDLEEVAIYLSQFRASHERTPDTELAWTGLTESVQQLTARE